MITSHILFYRTSTCLLSLQDNFNYKIAVQTWSGVTCTNTFFVLFVSCCSFYFTNLTETSESELVLHKTVTNQQNMSMRIARHAKNPALTLVLRPESIGMAYLYPSTTDKIKVKTNDIKYFAKLTSQEDSSISGTL